MQSGSFPLPMWTIYTSNTTRETSYRVDLKNSPQIFFVTLSETLVSKRLDNQLTEVFDTCRNGGLAHFKV